MNDEHEARNRNEIGRQEKEKLEAGPSKNEIKIIHGHKIDTAAEAATMNDEDKAWKIEAELRSIKQGLETMVSKVKEGSNAHDTWTIIDYNKVLDFISRGKEVDIFDKEDKYHVGVYATALRAQELAEEYEDFEAERRAMEKLQQQEEEGIQLAKRRDTALDNMRKIKMRLQEVKILEFSGAVMEPALNGFLYPEYHELARLIERANDMLDEAVGRAERILSERGT